MRILFIDPGYKTCGLADMEGDKLINAWQKTFTLPWPKRLDEIAGYIFTLDLIEKDPENERDFLGWDAVVIEQPDFYIFGHNPKLAEGVFKLFSAVSCIYTQFVNESIPTYMLPVSRWKGRGKKARSKKLTKELIEKLYPDIKIPAHAADAVHMGLWVMGLVEKGVDLKTIMEDGEGGN